MKVVRRHQTALFRQVHEAVRLHRISKNPGVKILNSKGEYNRCKLPRLQVQGQDEFKDPKEGGEAKYTLQDKQKKAKPNESKVFRGRQTETKPNMVELGEAKQQPRRVYRYVANNFRFKKKFDVETLNDKIDNSD